MKSSPLKSRGWPAAPGLTLAAFDDAGKYGFQAEGEAITKSALGLPRCVAVLILVYRHSRPTASFRPFARTEIDGEDQGGETSCRARRRRDGADHVEQADLAVSRSRPEILRPWHGEPRRPHVNATRQAIIVDRSTQPKRKRRAEVQACQISKSFGQRLMKRPRLLRFPFCRSSKPSSGRPA